MIEREGIEGREFFFYGEFLMLFSSRFFPSSVKTYGKTIQKLFSHCVKFSDLFYLCMSGDFFVMFEWRKKKFRRIVPDFISMCEMEWKKFRRTFFSHIWRQVKKVEFDWQCLTICDNVKKKMESVFYKKKKKMSGEMLWEKKNRFCFCNCENMWKELQKMHKHDFYI